MRTPHPPTLVLDWDGTVTEVDSLQMLLERFGDLAVFRRAERELGRRMTLKEVIEVELATVRAPYEEVVAWLLDHVRVRRGFRELVELHGPVIVSSGFHETIAPVLEREGVRAPVVANRVEPRPDGWRVRWEDATVCHHCDEACKRRSLPQARPLVFVGDGYSDRCAALAADRVFARDGLARYLEGLGAPFEPFEDFVGVARALARDLEET